MSRPCARCCGWARAAGKDESSEIDGLESIALIISGLTSSLCWQDDPRLYDMNVAERIEAFIEDNLAQAAQFRTNNIMLSMGADFVYSNANTWYSNMDKLIHYANKVMFEHSTNATWLRSGRLARPLYFGEIGCDQEGHSEMEW